MRMAGRLVLLPGLAAGFACVASAALGAEAGGRDAFAGVGVIAGDELVRMRAGQGDVTITVAGTQTLQATSAGNTVAADAITSGAVTVAGNALQNFSGVANFVFVTGNNDAVDAAVNLILVLE